MTTRPRTPPPMIFSPNSNTASSGASSVMLSSSGSGRSRVSRSQISSRSLCETYTEFTPSSFTPAQDERKNGSVLSRPARDAARRHAPVRYQPPHDRRQRISADTIHRPPPNAPNPAAPWMAAARVLRSKKFARAERSQVVPQLRRLPGRRNHFVTQLCEHRHRHATHAPAAPVTNTSRSPGTTPCRSNSTTHCIAVNPAVPIAIACFSVIPCGSRTNHFASTGASSVYPPQTVSDNPNPVITTGSPTFQSAAADSSTTPPSQSPESSGNLRITPGRPVTASPSL